MEQQKMIDSLETLKVLSDPLRVQLIAAIRARNEQGELATVKYLAGRFDRSPKKLYYHINLLEKHDLVKVADTRLVSGIVEKHYQVTARSFVVDSGIFSEPNDPQARAHVATSLVAGLLDATKNEVAQMAQAKASGETAPESPKSRNHISKEYAYLTSEQARHFQERLQEISAEFDAIGQSERKEGGRKYSLTAVFFPVLED